MTQYTIAVCNYNMADTIEGALRSILDQIDERFEVLVVDDGSTDGSVSIVNNLQTEYNSLRVIELPPDPGRYLGETRNISVREAKGEHVFLQLDADDVYDPVIRDFATIYETFRNEISEPFLFKGSSLTVGPKEFLLEHGPYRNLPVGAEDLDMWRRLLADDSVLWLDHDSPKTEVSSSSGLIPNIQSSIRRGIRVRTGEFQTGIRPTSRIQYTVNKWKQGDRSFLELLFEFVSTPYAYGISLARPAYDLPQEFKEKVRLEIAIADSNETLEEIEERLGVTVDRSVLSETGQKIFTSDS